MAACAQPCASQLKALPAAAARPPRRAARRGPLPLQAAAKQVAVPAPVETPEHAIKVHVPTAIAAAAVAAGVAMLWRRLSRQASAPAVTEYPGMAGLVRPAQSTAASEFDVEYKMALARTRQATAIHRAIGFLNTGSRARAHVEVRRALHQNSICRAPLLATAHSRADLLELYRLHLQQSDMPTDFGTLLQLRALLDLDFDEAEKVEREMAQQSTFNI